MKNKKSILLLSGACLFALLAFLYCSSEFSLQGKEGKPQLNFIRYFPEDALFAGSMKVEGMDTIADKIGNLVQMFGGDQAFKEFNDGIAKANADLGTDLKAQVANIVGEAGILIDVANIDTLVAAVGPNPKAAPQMILKNCCILFKVKDPSLFDSLMDKVSQKAGFKKEILSGGEVPVTKLDIVEPDLDLSIFYAQHKGAVLLGFSDETISSLIQRSKGTACLSTSPDYQRVFKHLPKNVDSWGYLNLPKIMKLLRESAVVQGFIAAKPEAQKVFEYAKGLEKDLFGAGWTSYRSEGAVLRQSCYPDVIPSFAGGATTIGIVSSIAIPNLMSSTQKEKQKRTMSDMRAIGVAVESFVVDNGMWPGPTKGYVPVEEIKAKLEPTYIRELPTKDAWGNPYLYWSNEKEYIFYSRGKDGQEDEPYGQEIGKKIQEAATSRFENDIIYSNGKFIRHPEGIQGELHVVPKK